MKYIKHIEKMNKQIQEPGKARVQASFGKAKYMITTIKSNIWKNVKEMCVAEKNIKV